MTSLSILDIGRRGDDGSPRAVIRCPHPPALLAVTVVTPRSQRIYLAQWILSTNVARLLRHVEDSHLPTLGVGVCYAPACQVAAELLPASEADAPPAIASSA